MLWAGWRAAGIGRAQAEPGPGRGLGCDRGRGALSVCFLSPVRRRGFSRGFRVVCGLGRRRPLAESRSAHAGPARCVVGAGRGFGRWSSPGRTEGVWGRRLDPPARVRPDRPTGRTRCPNFSQSLLVHSRSRLRPVNSCAAAASWVAILSPCRLICPGEPLYKSLQLVLLPHSNLKRRARIATAFQ